MPTAKTSNHAAKLCTADVHGGLRKCKNRARPGTEHCILHDPVLKQEAAEKRAEFQKRHVRMQESMRLDRLAANEQIAKAHETQVLLRETYDRRFEIIESASQLLLSDAPTPEDTTLAHAKLLLINTIIRAFNRDSDECSDLY